MREASAFWGRALWAATAVWAGAIFIGSSIPRGSGVPLPTEGIDKPIHAIAFGGLALLLGMALRASGRGRLPAAGLSLALATAYGMLDEWHQGFVPGRVPSRADLVADAVGAALGALLTATLPAPWRGKGTSEPTPDPADQ